MDILIEAMSGLGMFLFGMMYMENALKEFAGSKFKMWIKNSTNTNSKAIMTGAGATALLQSSSVITLMTLSFVSAALISLKGGIGLIFGANIGTTATAWLVAMVGFKIKIEAFALPMIGVGGLLIMFLKNQKLISFSKFLVGFGLLFFGLDILKTAIESSANHINLAEFQSYSLIVFLLIGLVITALIQSSSAATAIILSALGTNIITFEMAAAMVIGTNIGTTVTAFLGSIGGVPDKKRLALAHFLFNIITAIAAFVLLSFLVSFIQNQLGLINDNITALAVFHSIFNIMGVLLLAPFINTLATYLEKLFIQPKEIKTKYIHQHDPIESMGALNIALNEINNLVKKTIKFNLSSMHLKPKKILKEKHPIEEILESSKEELTIDYEKKYQVLKEIELETTKYLNKIGKFPLDTTQSQLINKMYVSMQEAVYGAKIIKASSENITTFMQSDNPKVHLYFNLIRTNLIHMVQNIIRFHDSDIKSHTIIEAHRELVEENQYFITKLTKNFEKEGIDQNIVVSLLNTNRSVLVSCNSIIDAAKVFRIKLIQEKKEE